MTDARNTAIEALTLVNRDGAYSNIAIDEVLKESELDRRDKAFASALFYGVLERKRLLDTIIASFSSNGIKSIRKYTLDVLRLGLYQILFMDSVPDRAAVNESVNMVKAKKKERYSDSFVNALLRSVIREENILEKYKDKPQILYSCCDFITDKLKEQYGEKYADILKSTIIPSKTYIRVNTMKTTAEKLKEQLESEKIQSETISDKTLQIVSGSPFTSVPYEKGLFHAEDLTSQMCADGVEANEDMSVFDVCAAPGGKTFTIAENMNGKGLVLSADIHSHRVSLIKHGAYRLGLNNVKSIKNDATVYNEKLGKFDRVLCDVPCSGTGVMRRKPEIKYKGKNAIGDLPAIQQKILETSALYLKEDGVLIYSTCSLFKEENEDNINLFINNHQEFKIESMKTMLPDENHDGFFIATLRR